MSDLEEFGWAHFGCCLGIPKGQEVIFFGATMPETMNLEKFAESFKDFILKKYGSL